MITLTQRAHQQLLVLNALERAELTVAEAATLLGRSTRHVRRLRAALVDLNFPLEEIAQECAVASKILEYMCHKLDGGSIDHIMLVAERYIVLLAVAGQDYFVGVVIDLRGNLGKARVRLKQFMPEIASVLNAVDQGHPES